MKDKIHQLKMNVLFVSFIAVLLLPCILAASLSKFDFEELNDDSKNLYWKEGNWQECKDGKQWRPVECFHEKEGKEYQVYLQACRDSVGNEPAHERECGHSGPQPVQPTENDLEWRAGEWQQCKDGKQWRSVECFHKKDGKEYQVYLKACRDAIGDEEPVHEQDCNHSGPQPVEPKASDLYWKTGDWGECKDGKQWRPVECFHEKDGKEYQVYLKACRDAIGDEEPVHEKDCNHSGPQPVEPKQRDLYWKTGDWGECVNGKRWRPVRCYDKNKEGGEDYEVLYEDCQDEIGNEEPVEWQDC